MSDLEFRPVVEAEWPNFLETTKIAFGNLPAPGDEAPDQRGWPLERSMAALEDGRVVGSSASFDFDLTLPGTTSAAAAGVTWVGVLPTHRRRGVLRGMMQHQLREVHERGVPLAVLLASESIIYGRFGYGLATTQVDLELERRHAVLASEVDVPGRVRLVTDPGEIRRLLPDIHERVRREQPGDVRRPPGWWAGFFDGGRAGSRFGPRFHVFYEGPSGEVEGYAYYRVGATFETPLSSDWTVAVQGLGALTSEGYLALWRYLWEVDLTGRLVASFRPPDEPLRHLLADPRRLVTTRSIDFLWCRLVDVPGALSARRYAVEGAVVVEVSDPVCPWNTRRWRLEGGPDGASCAPADGATADLSLSATELGAVYLGGTRLAALAAARRVDEHTVGAMARADLLFASARAPWCTTFF